MNKPTFQLKPLGAALRLQTTQKKQVSPSTGTFTNNYTTASQTHPLNEPSSSHNPLHTLVHTSCSQEVKHMRLRIVAFVFQLPEDCCSRTRLLPTLRMWFSFAPTKVLQVLFATNLWIRSCIIAMAADTEWCESQTCSTGPMSCRYHSITQWGQSIH